MNTTTQIIRPQRTPRRAESLAGTRRDAPPVVTHHPTFGELLDETLPLIGAVFVAGPPAIFVGGPLLLFVLMLLGPFLVLFALVVVLVAATVLVLLAGVILAMPYLLVRHLRGRAVPHMSPVIGARRRESVSHA